MPDFDFSKPEQTKYLWEKILSHWLHRDRPAGQRFLGSVCLKQQASDELLNVVGRNLSQLSRVTYHSLYEHFDEPRQNWLKILTFVLSEYAYYYSTPEDKFWQGCCQQMQLPYAKKPSTFTIRHRDGWIGVPSAEPFTPKATVQGEFYLAWHRQKDDLELKGCYLPKCAACGARPIRAQAINRFVSYQAKAESPRLLSGG